MIRSLAFTTKGSLHTKDIDAFLMPTLFADANLFLGIDQQTQMAGSGASRPGI